MKPAPRKLMIRALVWLVVLTCAVFTTFKLATRWNPDEKWAIEVIGQSRELRALLQRFHEENGEFPKSLSSISEGYAKPTNFLDRNGSPPSQGRWFYERIGTDDYQMFVCARSWVSFFDAMVYRHTGMFADSWNSSLKPSDYRTFGKWRYIRGFSRFDEKYYFDGDGYLRSISP